MTAEGIFADGPAGILQVFLGVANAGTRTKPAVERYGFLQIEALAGFPGGKCVQVGKIAGARGMADEHLDLFERVAGVVDQVPGERMLRIAGKGGRAADAWAI